jgi:hypothetical protein
MKKQVKTIAFKKSTSPFLFSNRISYTVGQSNSTSVFENDFYVSEITNYPESEITELKYDDFCNEKSNSMKTVFIKTYPNGFYLKYKKGLDQSKH